MRNEWAISYGHAQGYEIYLSERGTISALVELIGSWILDLSAWGWPWHIGVRSWSLGTAFYTLANWLINQADRHVKEVIHIGISAEQAWTINSEFVMTVPS